MKMTVQEQFGQIDIYVFDQILRGNIAPGMRVLDAGCGTGEHTLMAAALGLEATGFDVAATAIAIANTKARDRGWKPGSSS